jgi:Tfp pilus assembly protein PilN
MDNKNNISIPEKKNQHKGILPMIVLIILMAGALGYLVYEYQDQKSRMVEMEEVLTSEKDSLTHELENIMYRYDTLKTSNDTLREQIFMEKKRIKYLLRLQASNAQKIKLYKREIKTLREIMKSYIRQIDSLNTRNKMLTEENIQVKSQLHSIKKSKEKLEKEKEELTGKVEIASVIPAKNITVAPLNKKGKVKNKVDKIVKLKVCFTLRENPIAEAGYKTVYMRIQRPDSILLSGPEAEVFPVEDNKLVCSAKREVEYLNKDLDMCIFWTNDGSLIPGKYSVYLYLEGHNIGETTFLLK